MKLSELKKDRKTVPYEVPSQNGDKPEVVNIVVRPSAYEQEDLAAFYNLYEGRDEADPRLFQSFLAKAIIEWDLLDDEGIFVPREKGKPAAPVPTDAATLGKLPGEFIGGVFYAVIEAVRGGPKESSDSGSG